MDKKLDEELLKQVKDTIRVFLKKHGEKFLAYWKELESIVPNMPSLLAEAWGLEEKDCDTLAFDECVSWAKKHLSSERHSGVVILRQENSGEFSAGPQRRRFDIHAYFMDKQNEPILDGSEPHLLAHCDDVDASMKESFGDKDMILLK